MYMLKCSDKSVEKIKALTLDLGNSVEQEGLSKRNS